MLIREQSIKNIPSGSVVIFRDLDNAVVSYKNSDGKVSETQGYHGIFRIPNPVFTQYENLTGKILSIEKWTKEEFIFSLSEIIVGGGGSGKRGAAGPTGPTGPTGPSNLFANALFVDSQFGNDTNAVPFSLMDNSTNPASHKYQTIDAALAAANSGDVIIVYPGTYTGGNLWKNGVTFYFYPCDVTCDFTDSNGSESMRVYGSGRFLGNGNTTIQLSDFSTLYFEFDTITSAICVTIRDNQVTLRGNKIQGTIQGVECLGNTSFADIRIFVYDFIKTTGNNGRALQITPDSFGGNIFIETEEIISNGIIAVGAINIRCGGISGGGLITINANRIITTHAQASSVDNAVIKIGMQGGRAIINGNIYCSNANTIGIINSQDQDNINTSEFIFNGNIDVLDSAIVFLNPLATMTGIYRFNGKFLGQNSALGTGYEAVIPLNMASGDTMKLFLNGEVNNRVALGNGIKKSNVTDPDIILNTIKVITNGGNALVSDTALDTYKTIFVSARNTANLNMTNSIVGSVDYLDANIE